MQSQPLDSSTGDRSASAAPARRSAAIAARRAARSHALLGLLGLASFGLVLLRLVETWRVSPQRVSHHVVIFGQTLSYPAANMAAVIVLVLAVLGAVVTARALLGVAREVTGARRLHRRLAPASRRDLGGALVIDDERPHAFCAGLLSPRVYVTSGALAILDDSALEAVLAHERHHARRRDPLRLATSRVLTRAMFFLPALGELDRGQQALAEMSADESAIEAEPGNRSALARAMLTFSDASEADDSVGIDPASSRLPARRTAPLAVSGHPVPGGDRTAGADRRHGGAGRPRGSGHGDARAAIPLGTAVRGRARHDPCRGWARCGAPAALGLARALSGPGLGKVCRGAPSNSAETTYYTPS